MNIDSNLVKPATWSGLINESAQEAAKLWWHPDNQRVHEATISEGEDIDDVVHRVFRDTVLSNYPTLPKTIVITVPPFHFNKWEFGQVIDIAGSAPNGQGGFPRRAEFAFESITKNEALGVGFIVKYQLVSFTIQ